MRLQPPRKLHVLSIVQVARRNSETHLHGENPADLPPVNNLLHPLEIRQITTVISNETGHTGLFGNTVDAYTVLIRGCQRLFNIAGLSGTHGHNGEGGMGGRRRSDIDGVDIRIVDQCLCIGVPPLNTMTLGIRTCLQLTSAEHSHDM